MDKCFIFILLFLPFLTLQGEITLTTVSCDPSIVGLKNATLSLAAYFPQQVPNGGSIKITLPSDTSIVQGDLTSSCQIFEDKIEIGIGKFTCSASGQVVNIVLSTSQSLTDYVPYSIFINNKFTTPSSTISTISFQIATYSDSNGANLLDQQTNNIFLTVAANTLKGTSISQTSRSSTIVGAMTQANVSITIQTQIPADAVIVMKFPKLNKDSPISQQKSMIQSTSLKCSKDPQSTNVNQNLNCQFSSDTLIVQNIVSASQPSSSTLSFLLDGIINPYNFTALQIQVKTMTSNQLGTIDEGVMSFQSKSRCDLVASQIKVYASNDTVQEYATFNIDFQSPIPLSVGTIFTIVFPSEDFTFDSRLTTVQGFGLFGSLRTLKFNLDTSQRSVQILNGIETYRQAGITGKLSVQSIQNPQTTRKSQSFKIYIQDSNGETLASLEQSVYFQSNPGWVQGFSVNDVTGIFVNQQTDITLTIKVVRRLSSQNSLIKITFPQNMLSSSATIVEPEQGFYVPTFSCERSLNNNNATVFTCSKLFQSAFDESTSLQLTISNMINPNSCQPVKGLSIQTYDQVASATPDGYLVDTIIDTSTQILEVFPNQFYIAQVSASTNLTYTTSNFTFDLTLRDPLPQKSFLTIILPPEVTPSPNLACIGTSSGTISQNLQCSLSSSNVTIKNLNALPNPNTRVQFVITNIRSPISTRTSSTFKVYSYDASGYLINVIEQLVFVTMSVPVNIGQLQIQASSNKVNDPETWIQARFTNPVPLKAGDQFVIQLPESVGAPERGRLICNGDGKILNSNLVCQVNDQIITITVNLPSSNTLILAYQSLFLKFGPVKNPASTKPTEEFKIEIIEKEGYLMAQTLPGNLGFYSVGSPGALTNTSIILGDSRPFARTTVTISFTTESDIPVGGLLQFDFDAIYYVFPDDKSIVTCSTNLVSNAKCEFTRQSRIVVRDLFKNSRLIGGSQITFTVDNCYLEVDRRMVINSWQVSTTTDDGYAIDRVTNGLTVSFPCNAPCLTCPDQSPTYCLSCNTLSGSPILYLSRCYSVCPPGLYLNAELGSCLPCNPKCKTCHPNNPNLCLSCDPLFAEYPFLEGTTCTETCSQSGFYANKGTNKCEKCSDKCLECSGNSSFCTKCNNTGQYKFLNQNTCLEACPSGFTYDTNTYECIKCNNNCLECAENQPDICTSCNSTRVLSLIDRKCVSQCPSEITVFDVKSGVCRQCDPKCATCSKKISFCTSCPSGLFLQQNLGQCVGQCSKDYSEVSINGVCTNCSESCGSCINKPDSCLTCTSKAPILHDFKCLNECPNGYEVITDTNSLIKEQQKCILSGLRCPFGHEVNPQGNGCILKSQICEEGFILNANKDRCIPGPGKYVPFPLIITAGILIVGVLLAKIKKRDTKLTTCIIIALSFIETVGIFVQLIHSYLTGIYSTFGLTLIAACFQYGCNLFFSVVFIKQIKKSDMAFKYFYKNHLRTIKVTLYLSSCMNFKLFRIIYCNFYSLPQFNAVFDDSQLFFKPFVLVSNFNIVTTMMPLMIANICGFVFMGLGYQLTVTNVEMTIIEIAMLILILYEKVQLKKTVMKEEVYYKVEPKLLDSQNVMSAFNGSINYDSLQTSNIQTLKTEMNGPMYEHHERRRQLEKLIKQITYSSIPGEKVTKGTVTMMKHQIGIKDTEQQIKDLQNEEINNFRQHRRCLSAIDLREIDKDFDHQDSILKQGQAQRFWDLAKTGNTNALQNNEAEQNYLSEPVSPREKELLQNPRFTLSVLQFKRACRERDMTDNVYAEAKPKYMFSDTNEQQVNKRTQTSMAELMALDDMIGFRLRMRLQSLHQQDPEDYRPMFDQKYNQQEYNPSSLTRGLIENLIESIPPDLLSVQRPKMPEQKVKKVPQFSISDITGVFDQVSHQGQTVSVIYSKNTQTVNTRNSRSNTHSRQVIQKNESNFYDKEGHRVNQRGYLIDIEGNIVNKKGKIIFKQDDLASDLDLPEPFFSQKHVQQGKFMIQIQQNQSPKKSIGKPAGDLSQDESQSIDTNVRTMPFRSRMGMSGRVSQTSGLGMARNSSNKKSRITNTTQEQEDEDIEEEFVSMDKILKPMQAKSKLELLQSQKLKPPLIPSRTQTGFRSYSKGVRNLNDIETPTSMQQPIQMSSIGLGFDKTMQSFNKYEQNSSSLNIIDDQTSAECNGFNFETRNIPTRDQNISRLMAIRKVLDPSSKEDLTIMREIDAYEQTIHDEQLFRDARDLLYNGKNHSKLAMRNLAKVYGNTNNGKKKQSSRRWEDKDDDMIEELTFKPESISYGIKKDSRNPNIQKSSTQVSAIDSKLKGLQDIYMQKTSDSNSGFQTQQGFYPNKGINLKNRRSSESREQKFRPLVQTANSVLDINSIKVMEEEQRVKKEIDKMQAILDKEKRITQNINKKYQKSRPNGVKNLIEGGWI